MDTGKSVIKEPISISVFQMTPYYSILGTNEKEQGCVQGTCPHVAAEKAALSSMAFIYSFTQAFLIILIISNSTHNIHNT